jgi:hypothetical protein
LVNIPGVFKDFKEILKIPGVFKISRTRTNPVTIILTFLSLATSVRESLVKKETRHTSERDVSGGHFQLIGDGGGALLRAQRALQLHTHRERISDLVEVAEMRPSCRRGQVPRQLPLVS